MSTELIPILVAVATVGVGLAGLMVGLFAWLHQDVRRIDDRLDRLENRLAAVEHGQAKLEGLLEGLREAIVGHRAAS